MLSWFLKLAGATCTVAGWTIVFVADKAALPMSTGLLATGFIGLGFGGVIDAIEKLK